jgi:hypothetical protein
VSELTLPEALERAARALRDLADAIRPANGDPHRLLEFLDAAAAARVLEWLLRQEPAAGAELVAAWSEEPERGGAALREVKAEGLPKEVRKVLRRAHHGLRSRGLAVPEPAPPPLVAKLPPIESRLEAALVSAVDPRGARVAFLVESNPGGGARMFELLLDDVRGVLGIEVYSAGRSRVRKFLREATTRPGTPVVEVPASSLRALVARIAAAQPADRALPRGFAEWRSHVAGAPQDAATPGELAREALGDEAGPEAAGRVAERIRSGALGPWPPLPGALRELASRIVEIGKGRIIVSGLQRREQIERAVQDSLGSVFDAGFAAATARRLEESAYVAWKRERSEEARELLAAARALREDPAGSPVARAMLDVALAPVLSGLEAELAEEEKSSLLVKP